MLWSIGKDSTVLLWLARKAFFGHVPFPLVHVDTTYKIASMIEYRDRLVKEWNLKLVVGKIADAALEGLGARKEEIVEEEIRTVARAAVEEAELSDEELLGEATLAKLVTHPKDLAPAELEEIVELEENLADEFEEEEVEAEEAEEAEETEEEEEDEEPTAETEDEAEDEAEEEK
jgi:hypothetical protein